MNFACKVRLALWGWVSRLLLVPVFARYWWLGRREPAYRQRWKERLGFVEAGDPGRVWLHAVSLGEVRAATPLIEALLGAGHELLVSCTTAAGSAEILRRFAGRARHLYAPLDTPGAVARFVGRVRPRALILLEAELWPQLLFACRRRGVPVLLANARMTARSFVGYRRHGALFRPLFAGVATALARTDEDAERLLQLGFGRVQVAGDLKYSAVGGDEVRQLAPQLAEAVGLDSSRPLLVAGSTHEGEEETLLQACQSIRDKFPALLLLLAPRQPQRFGAVAELLKRRGLKFATRSSGNKTAATDEVLLLDQLGELAAWYLVADVAFVGGSLVPAGGHNLLEAAAAARPVLTGPHLENFAEAARSLGRVGALVQVQDAAQLAGAALEWLADEPKRRAAGQAGRALIEAGQGSLEHHLRAIGQLLQSKESPDRG